MALKPSRWHALLFLFPMLVLGGVMFWVLRVEREREQRGLLGFFEGTVRSEAEGWDETTYLPGRWDADAIVRVPESVFEPGWRPQLMPPDADELARNSELLAKFEDAKRLLADGDRLKAREILSSLNDNPETDGVRTPSGLPLRTMALRMELDSFVPDEGLDARGAIAQQLIAEAFRVPTPLSQKLIEDAAGHAYPGTIGTNIAASGAAGYRYPRDRAAGWLKMKELFDLVNHEQATTNPLIDSDGGYLNGPMTWKCNWSKDAPWLHRESDWWFADFSRRDGFVSIVSLEEVESALFLSRDDNRSGAKSTVMRYRWHGNVLRDGLGMPGDNFLASATKGPLEVFLYPRAGYDWRKTVNAQIQPLAWKLGIAWCVVGMALLAAWLIYRERARLAELESNFIASVSHELRTPVASISVLAERLESGKVLPENVATYHRLISREGQRLAALIDNVLDFSRIHQDRKEYEFKDIDFHRLVTETVDFLRPYAEQRKLALKLALTLPENALTPMADAIAVRQMLVNLIDNAIKFSPPGGAVLVTLCGRIGGIEFWVEDSGKGIPFEERSRIFRRFYRADNGLTRETTGAGIGLSIVKHIVNAHNGSIDLETSSLGGAKFMISLPGTHDH